MTLNYLTPMEIDLLKELTNIGGGNAATALSELVKRQINMEVPNVSILEYDKLFSTIMKEEEKVYAVSIRILGDTPGNFLFITKEQDTLDLINLLIDGKKTQTLDEFGVSALKEICNIICSSYLNAISRMLDITLISSVPAFVNDMFGAIMPTIYIEAGHIDDSLLMIENYFLTGTGRIQAHLFFIPNPGSLEKIFSYLKI